MSSRDLGIAEKVSAPRRFMRGQWGWAEWREFLAFGRRPEPIPSFTGAVEDPQPGKVGIACSGGGIRSAAFNLGALQVLQKGGVLQRASYLSAVSGGSYIASAFCMVRNSDPDLLAGHPPFFPGSPEEQYLRNRSSYLAPGFLGKLQLGYRVILGLIANLGFVGAFLLIASVPLAFFYGWVYSPLTQRVGSCGKGVTCDFGIQIPASIYLGVIGLAGFALIVGLASILAYRWTPWLRDLTETWSSRLLLLAAVAAVGLIGVPLLLAIVRGWGEGVTSTAPAKGIGAVGIGGVTTVGAGILLQLRAEWVEVRKLADEAAGAARWYTGLGLKLRRGLAYLIAAVVGPALALLLVLVAMSAVLNAPHDTLRWAAYGALVVVFSLGYLFADLTTWSLHPFYRRRLASAFSLERVKRPQGMPPIAGDEAGIAVERDYDKLILLSESAIEPGPDGESHWPTLLVCASANVSDNAATPPGRSVTSFTFSPSSIGGPLVGAVKTTELEKGCDDYRRSFFTLPAAVAMSGAAISPSMGKMTRPPLRLLMALANIRLGVWVPNPRRLDAFSADKRFYPRPRPSYLLREMFGVNPINSPFLYVTDGGHYENLGAMELLRRGCTEIYAFDASNDNFDALGDFISLARSELEVEIVDFDRSALEVDKEGYAKTDAITAKIVYPGEGAPTGTLHYVRPVMTREAPTDAAIYHAEDPRFPHDPTADQLYTDQRFEAYRALGARAAGHTLGS